MHLMAIKVGTSEVIFPTISFSSFKCIWVVEWILAKAMCVNFGEIYFAFDF